MTGAKGGESIHECDLCRNLTCPCTSDQECDHYCPNDEGAPW